MIKILWLFALAIIAWRLIAGRWPWQPGAAALKRKAHMQARELLGVGDNASKDDIIEAHKRLVAMVHPDRGGRNEDVHAANAARDILLGNSTNHSQEQP